jgi:hypothetical protein
VTGPFVCNKCCVCQHAFELNFDVNFSIFIPTSCFHDRLTYVVHIQAKITSRKDSPAQICTYNLSVYALECVHLGHDLKYGNPGFEGKSNPYVRAD